MGTMMLCRLVGYGVGVLVVCVGDVVGVSVGGFPQQYLAGQASARGVASTTPPFWVQASQRASGQVVGTQVSSGMQVAPTLQSLLFQHTCCGGPHVLVPGHSRSCWQGILASAVLSLSGVQVCTLCVHCVWVVQGVPSVPVGVAHTWVPLQSFPVSEHLWVHCPSCVQAVPCPPQRDPSSFVQV